MAEPASIDWAKLRADYESGIGISTLAKRYGTTRNTIKRRINVEAWSTADHAAAQVVRDAARPHATTAQAVSAKVVDIATRQAVDQIGPAIAAAVLSGLTRHVELETRLLDLALDTIEKSIAGTLRAGKHSSQASERKDAIAAAAQAIAMSREIAGKRPGQASVTDTSATAARRFHFVLPKAAAPEPDGPVEATG